MCVLLVWFFFFFKQKTAYEMRISDWSSDVCSSDLAVRPCDRPTPGLGDRLRQVAAFHPEPAVIGPFDGIEQRLPAQGPIAVLIAVIDAPPVARRSLDQRRMAARPPFFGRRSGANERVRGAIFQRPMNRPRPRRDDHMAGPRAGGDAARRPD